jgi:hypothetical protein
MIDTLNMRITAKDAGDVSPLSVERYIDVEKSGVYVSTGVPYIVGHVAGYRVYADSEQVRLSGSIAKLIHGENVSDLNRKGVAEGVQCLSEALHLNIGRAEVVRLDVAHTFDLPAEPEVYIGELSSRAEMERASIGENTLYFVSKGRALCLYDKRAEMRHRGQEMPPAWADCQHLLRYELRLSGSVARQIGARTLTTQDITKPQRWAQLVNLWADEYRSIGRTSTDRIATSTTPKEAFNAIFADLLQYAPADYLQNTLKMLCKRGVMIKQRRADLKKMIEEALNGCRYSLINQLDVAVERVRAEAVSV